MAIRSRSLAHRRARLPSCRAHARRGLAAARAAVCTALASSVVAQETPPAAGAEAAPQTVVVEGRAEPSTAGIGRFGDISLGATPLQVQAVNEAQLRDAGIEQASGLTKFDAAVNDAYDAPGYWTILSVRGYTLDNRFNFRRDGLPINAETAIGLDNKSALLVLKGISGMQAGTSAPGGIVDFVVKRPASAPLRSALVGWEEDGTLKAAVDLSQRFGEGGAFGLRLNAAAARLDPETRDLEGHRRLFALAGEGRAPGGALVEAEIENSRQSQPSVPGFSLLGGRIPDAHTINPRTNLNDQPWSQPVVLDGTTASLRYTQPIGEDWRLVAHGMVQRLKSDDRLAFPFGCSAENHFDRYCSDGTYDLYDFRSENERRRSDALDLSMNGALRAGGIEQQLSGGVLLTRFRSRFGGEAYNDVGTGNIEGTLFTVADPSTFAGNTDRSEHSTELYLRDALRFGERFGAWLGLRHTRLSRESELTDGAERVSYDQSFTTPWAALSVDVAPGQLVYLSWGQGVESYVVPNRPTYSDAGAPLPAQKSRQWEFGAKGDLKEFGRWRVAAFDIHRPAIDDTGEAYEVDGTQRHRGVEAQLEGRGGGWQWLASAMALKARYEGASDASGLSGVRPPNVPARDAKILVGRDIDPVPGLQLQGALAYEGSRTLLPQEGSPAIGGWTRIDLAAKCQQRVEDVALTWRVGVDNVADRRAWRESPYQYGHVYLYPLQPRTWRASLQADF